MVDILESKVVGTNKETWYKLVGTSEDTKPIGEFPAGTGHTVANGSRFYEVDTEIGYELKEEGWVAVGQNVRLPDVTAEDNGKVLSVVEGNWDKAQPANELPDVTAEDNDKVLKVVNGVWDKAAMPSAGLPEVTSSDNGDVLTVVNGEWSKSNPNITKIYTITPSGAGKYDLQDGALMSDVYSDLMNGVNVIIVADLTTFKTYLHLQRHEISQSVDDDMYKFSSYFYDRDGSKMMFMTAEIKNTESSTVRYTGISVNVP